MSNIWKSKQVFSTDYNSFQGWMAEKMGIKSFDILESPNDSTHAFNVKGRGEDKFGTFHYDEEDFEEAKKQGSIEYYSLGVLLNVLCDRGEISEGEYQVEVCW